ncbi:MAG TPA: Rpn family recombination-promoting nuclease/putative transposase [Spirochaetota bacterium]|nr:Rpn family recombination-promoting nuclease/putative transposase [Spirochaetota bacterium]HXK64699.1 Rpn family recombination-promoting nuclease/putative transposase [Spirochaetota bacterium]
MAENIHDKGYKYLFSNPLMVKELLESFVYMDWVKEVDFTQAETIDKTYVNDYYKEYEADIIYKLRFKNTDMYIYLLIEFQSTVDKFIAFRMLQYIVELYRELIYSHNVKKLPVVFPIMIYNGDKVWKAPLTLEELIDIPEILHECLQYVPRFRYYPLIENELNPVILQKMMNVISTVFLLETGDDAIFYKTIDRIKDLVQIYTEKGEFLLIRTLLYWLLHYLQSHGIVDGDEKISENLIKTPQEATSMLAQTLKKIKSDLIKEGFNKGIEKGIQKGIKQGKLIGKHEERIAIARNLLKSGIDDKTIIKITKLTKDQLKELKNR